MKQRCLGEPVKLDQNEIKEANRQLNEQIEGEWRLPSRKELESLVCDSCEGAKINKKLFQILLPNHFGHRKKLVVSKVHLVS